MEVASSSTSTLIKDSKSTKSVVDETARSRSHRNLCIGVSVAVAVVLFLVVIIVILAFTVFKPKRPITTINSVSIDDFDLSLSVVRTSVDFNITLVADVAITNPNKVGFSYSNSTAFFNYRGELVGEVPILAAQIDAGQTTQMNITLRILADRFVKTSTVFFDVVAGSMPLNAYARVSGKVRILGIFNIHMVSTTSCDFSINISERNIKDQQCNYHTKI